LETRTNWMHRYGQLYTLAGATSGCLTLIRVAQRDGVGLVWLSLGTPALRASRTSPRVRLETHCGDIRTTKGLQLEIVAARTLGCALQRPECIVESVILRTTGIMRW